MGLKVGINGFGRIGRNIFRAALGNPEFDFVAVNDLTSTETLAHLLAYDSILGNLHHAVKASGDTINVEGDSVKVLSVKNRRSCPGRTWAWTSYSSPRGCSPIAMRGEAPGRRREEGDHHRAREEAGHHRRDGRERRQVDPATHHIISNASCTTNCLAPFAKVLHESFGIKRGWMTTVHSYTNDQQLLDPAAQGSGRRARPRCRSSRRRPAPPRPSVRCCPS